MHKFAFANKNLESKKKISFLDITFLRTSKKNGLRRNFLKEIKKFFSKKVIKKNDILLKPNVNY